MPLSPCLPPNNSYYGSLSYWEDRYSQEESFDWFKSYSQLHVILSTLNKQDFILQLG